MDISGWTIYQRLWFPDWCFGQREMTGVMITKNTIGFTWAIGSMSFPDPACLWSLVIVSMPEAGGRAQLKLGLADAVPTNQAEMAAATELLPYAWWATGGPNIIVFQSGQYSLLQYQFRHALVTGGKKLVVELNCLANIRVWFHIDVVTTGLPTNVSSWLTRSYV